MVGWPSGRSASHVGLGGGWSLCPVIGPRRSNIENIYYCLQNNHNRLGNKKNRERDHSSIFVAPSRSSASVQSSLLIRLSFLTLQRCALLYQNRRQICKLRCRPTFEHEIPDVVSFDSSSAAPLSTSLDAVVFHIYTIFSYASSSKSSRSHLRHLYASLASVCGLRRSSSHCRCSIVVTRPLGWGNFHRCI
ncbi:hypothetical protein PIB30_024898 [Stylosanthes scabra]|uniref:Uncharacterized protein n=1 Tax=Stylosanthes scabra TaxID=79078 RepID=A0ABU6SA16_9FABA|nr:hypothetical protein [Stylosanthes scabra]